MSGLPSTGFGNFRYNKMKLSISLSRYEFLALIPDKPKLAVYYPHYSIGGGLTTLKRVSRTFDEFMSMLPDEIGFAQFCFVPAKQNLGLLIWVGSARQRGKSCQFCIKPDAKKLKRFEKLTGMEIQKTAHGGYA